MPDDVAGAHERRAFNRAREHRAGRQRAAHQPLRQNRKPDARRDRAHPRLRAGALPEGRDGQIVRLKDRIQKGAAGAALFPQKQIAGRHIREGEAVFLQKRVIRREDEHQLVAGKRLAGQVAMLDRRFDHGQIEAVIQQHFLERIDVGDGGLQAQARPRLLHALHNAGQLVIAQRDARADAQHAALVVVAQLANILVVHVIGYAIERRLRRTRRYLLARKVPVKTVVETLLPNGLKGVCVLTGGTDAFLLVSSLGHTHDNVVDYVLGKGPLSRPDTDDATQLASHFIVCLFFADIEQYRTDSK